jgi:SPP1 family predicted phage head-tail adaptor
MLQSSIRRGEMDRTVTFIKKVIGTNATNEDEITSWIEVATDPTVSAKKVDLKGDTMLIADRPTYVQNTKFTVDHRTDINTENRLVCGGRVYEIIAVLENNSSREFYIDVICNLLDTEVWT